MNPLRTAAAILAGVMLLGFIDQTLERTLVIAIAATPPPDEASYLAVRNRPSILATTVVTHALAATLAGYIIGRIAGVQEVRHALGAAVLTTVMYAWAFASGGAMLPPVWVRAAMLIVTPPALVAGAKIRADARSIHEEAGARRPEERS